MASDSQVAEFRRANQDLTLLAQSQLRDFLSSFRLDGDPVRVRNALLAFFPELVTTYGDVSALLAADFYDMVRDVPPSAASFRAAYSAPVDARAAEGSVRWAVGPLFPGSEPVYEFDPMTGAELQVGTRLLPARPDMFLEQILGATQRLVSERGRGTIFSSAAADPIRTGVARVPQGLSTCAFCIMLASRGAVYQSEVSAELIVGRGSNRTGYDANGKRLSGGIGQGTKTRGAKPLAEQFHDNCDCTTVTIRKPSDWPEGHDLEAFRDLYKKGSGVGRDIPTDN